MDWRVYGGNSIRYGNLGGVGVAQSATFFRRARNLDESTS